MPFALIVAGLLLVIAGARDKQDKLFALVKGDLSGDSESHGFILWFFTIIVIGSIGYVESLKPLSRAFLVLIIIVLFLKNGGVTEKFVAGIKGGPADNPFSDNASIRGF